MIRAFLGLAVALGLSCLPVRGNLWAQEWDGARLKVTGTWEGDRLLATRVQERGSGKDPRLGKIEGTISAVDPAARTLHLGPLQVSWDQSTQFSGISPRDLIPGRAIEAAGKLDGATRILAQEVQSAPPASQTLQVLGTVGSSERLKDGGRLFTILGLQVEVPRRVLAQSSDLTRNPNNRRPDRQLTVPLFQRPLTIGGEVGTSSRFRRGYQLDGDPRDNALGLEQQLQLELTYPLSSSALLFLTGETGYESELHSAEGSEPTQWDLKRNEMWLYLEDIGGSGFGIQIGRQNFREPREWWWGNDLDGIRVRYDRRRLHAELAVAEELAPTSTLQTRIDPEQQGVRRWLGQAAWSWRTGHRLDGFFLRQRDHSGRQSPGNLVPSDREDPTDDDLTWLGARASGTLDLHRAGELDYWLDGARVRGKETALTFADAGKDRSRVTSQTQTAVAGWAVDGGLSWATDLPAKPTFSLGYARGSGGVPSSAGTDKNFRQTGLQDNNNRFRGVDRFRYYGELLRPELSNLEIFTASGGVPLLSSSSLELIYHRYWQVHPATTVAGSGLHADPLGFQRAIGSEWDLVLGIQEWEHIEIELVAGLFRAGPAYGPQSGMTVHAVSVKMDLNF